MSISDSNLAKYKGGTNNVDMTVSVTEDALNSQILQYLWSMSTAENQKPHRERVYMLSFMNKDARQVIFTVGEDTDYNTIPEGFPEELLLKIKEAENKNSTLFKELEELRLFEIENGASVSIDISNPRELSDVEERIQKAVGCYVKYAIFIEDGIPDALLKKLDDSEGRLDASMKPIILQPDTKNVLFRQFFRNICGIQISQTVTGTYPQMKMVATLSKIEQKDKKNIWYFPFHISLDFRAASYENSPEEVRKKINSMARVSNPDDVFQISQLVLDLETLSTTQSPTIESFDHDVDGILTNMIRAYFDRLEKAGQTVFGSVITTKSQSATKYLFTPRMRNYHISPRTLDYLIGFSDSKVIPNLGNDVNLLWESESSPLIAPDNPNNAAIAISSAYFLPFITKMVQPVLKCLTKEIKVFSSAAVYKDKFSVDASCNALDSDPCFKEGGTAGRPYFAYSFANECKDKRRLMWQPPLAFPVASLQLSHRYNAYVKGYPGFSDFGGTLLPGFIFGFTITGWLLIDYDTNTSCQGIYYDQTIKMAIGIAIDSQTGNIKFCKDVEKIDNQPAGLPQTSWNKFISAGHIKDYVRKLEGILSSIMDDIENYSIEEFIKSVDSQIGFVMPGNKTFSFIYDKPGGKVRAITESGDLYLFGNYVQEVAP